MTMRAATFQDQFRRIFVDEFQDTDPVQAEVLLLLAAGDPAERDWRKAVPAPGKLFLVGDPKQSIYRFRRADVSRYLDVKTVLAAAGVKQESLQQCRRSVQPILDFVNAAFEPLMGENYLPLMGGRPDIPGQPAVIALPMPAPYGKRNFSAKAIEKCAPDTVAAFVAWLIRQSAVARTRRAITCALSKPMSFPTCSWARNPSMDGKRQWRCGPRCVRLNGPRIL